MRVSVSVVYSCLWSAPCCMFLFSLLTFSHPITKFSSNSRHLYLQAISQMVQAEKEDKKKPSNQAGKPPVEHGEFPLRRDRDHKQSSSESLTCVKESKEKSENFLGYWQYFWLPLNCSFQIHAFLAACLKFEFFNFKTNISVFVDLLSLVLCSFIELHGCSSLLAVFAQY